MSKSKKLIDSSRMPQPIKVKKEKTEEDRTIYSMVHFVDDRLELVKQIFGSLKNKTITNLAPEYLKEREMEEIQELCLNELLCLSKKRLLSIINDTHCPTDTESSDEDSDVKANEEHVSLEEISSDSEIENGGETTAKSKAKKLVKKANNVNDKDGSQGQMSVLELLELQARARAIRSQLALEPVTKIEVDSDEGSEIKEAEQTSTKTTEKKSKSKRSEKPTTSSSKKKALKENSSKSQKTVPPTPTPTEINDVLVDSCVATENQISKQKIKIKRNFRSNNQKESTENESLENGEKATTKPIEKEQPITLQQGMKKEKRSPSPDVIPIVADPEVLSISDSSSDEEDNARKEQQTVMQQTVSTSIDDETEDGEIVETYKTDEQSSKELNIEKAPVIMDAEENNDKNDIESNSPNNENLDKSHENQLIEPAILSLHDNGTELENKTKDQVIDKVIAPSNTDIITAMNSPKTADKSELLRQSPVLNDDNGDHSDDIISIEGGDLENEMSEHLDEDASSKHSGQSAAGAPVSNSNSNGIDIVSLDSSESENETKNERNAESWQSRYMRSSKVHKVLAVSRLGKRVRDKLKTSKRSKKELNSDKPSKDEMGKSSKYVSKHEDGSIDQYKELIQMSQRKS